MDLSVSYRLNPQGKKRGEKKNSGGQYGVEMQMGKGKRKRNEKTTGEAMDLVVSFFTNKTKTKH